METLDNLTTLLATVFTVLFSAGAWKFYESRLKLKTCKMKEMSRICTEMI
jgi:hypothetical protein